MSELTSSNVARRRFGRAVVFVHQHDTGQISQDVAVEVEALLAAGKAMDFAASPCRRLRM